MQLDHAWHTKVTISCITVTAILEAAEETIAHSPHIAAALSEYGWIHYAPALLLTVAGISWLWGRYRKGREFSATDADKIVRDVKYQGGRSILLSFFHARATELQQQLEELWHHWDNAGEKLVHPLDAVDKLKDYSADGMMALINERRDFMVLYAHHLNTVKVELPELTSPVIEAGYPSDCEYQRVLANLKAHAEKLKVESDKSWKAY